MVVRLEVCEEGEEAFKAQSGTPVDWILEF